MPRDKVLSKEEEEKEKLYKKTLIRLRKLHKKENDPNKKQKLYNLRKNFIYMKKNFTDAEMNGLHGEKNMKIFRNYINTWVIKFKNNNKTVNYKK